MGRRSPGCDGGRGADRKDVQDICKIKYLMVFIRDLGIIEINGNIQGKLVMVFHLWWELRLGAVTTLWAHESLRISVGNARQPKSLEVFYDSQKWAFIRISQITRHPLTVTPLANCQKSTSVSNICDTNFPLSLSGLNARK